MATIINADTSDGLKLTSDTSGQIDLQSAGSTKATVSSAGLASTVGGDVSMSSAAAGQLKVNGSGYSFAVALDASAAHLYHNSASRDLVLGINETEQMKLTRTGDLKFNSGFGSVGTAYGVRAWVSVDATGTPSINDSGNVSSIVDRALGKFSINLTNAMPDTNYTVTGTTPSNGQLCTIDAEYTKTTSQASVLTFAYNGSSTDYNPVHIIVVR